MALNKCSLFPTDAQKTAHIRRHRQVAFIERHNEIIQKKSDPSEAKEPSGLEAHSYCATGNTHFEFCSFDFPCKPSFARVFTELEEVQASSRPRILVGPLLRRGRMGSHRKTAQVSRDQLKNSWKVHPEQEVVKTGLCVTKSKFF